MARPVAATSPQTGANSRAVFRWSQPKSTRTARRSCPAGRYRLTTRISGGSAMWNLCRASAAEVCAFSSADIELWHRHNLRCTTRLSSQNSAQPEDEPTPQWRLLELTGRARELLASSRETTRRSAPSTKVRSGCLMIARTSAYPSRGVLLARVARRFPRGQRGARPWADRVKRLSDEWDGVKSLPGIAEGRLRVVCRGSCGWPNRGAEQSARPSTPDAV